MKKAKKILCLLLSVAMLVSCFAFSASAVPADGKEVAYKLVADKESYNPGDIVTFSFYVDVADTSVPYGAAAWYFSYDNTVFSSTVSNRTFYNDFEVMYKPNGAVTSSATVHNAIKSALAATGEDAKYNASFVVAGIWNTSSGIPSADGYCYSGADTLQMTFQMQVLDSVAPGTTSSVALTQGAVNTPARCYLKHPDNTKVTSENYDLTNATATVKVGSTVVAPSVVKSAGQIKMTATSATTVEDAFQLRITSKITAADWDANFVNTAVDGATANYITKVGMVAYTGAADAYSLDDAKAAIAAGASNGDYYYGDTDYIKHADGEDATFGTVLKCTHGSEKLRNDPICLGFVSYVDAAGQAQTIYYAETYTAPIVSNYDTLAANYAQNYFGK